MRLKLFAFALIATLGTIAAAQEQDQRGKYRPRTLGQIVKQHSQRVTDIKAGTYSLFTADGFPSRVAVTYTGQSRKIAPKRKEFIAEWEKTLTSGQKITELFEDEFLFVEDSVEYWLPVQKRLIPYFKQELKKGERIELLLMWIGAKKESEKVDWVFLVNEFEKE
jgi:hypothetical protein